MSAQVQLYQNIVFQMKKLIIAKFLVGIYDFLMFKKLFLPFNMLKCYFITLSK